ncbi:DUF2613 family protein [Intrasporangium oryzae]|nr:DUF2613 family protein [Intrasporangium oryzae]
MLAKVIGPVVAGAVLACVGLFGLVASQTAAPATNPASKEILTYGDR